MWLCGLALQVYEKSLTENRLATRHADAGWRTTRYKSASTGCQARAFRRSHVRMADCIVDARVSVEGANAQSNFTCDPACPVVQQDAVFVTWCPEEPLAVERHGDEPPGESVEE